MTALKDSLCSVKVGSKLYKSLTAMSLGDIVLIALSVGVLWSLWYYTVGALLVKSQRGKFLVKL